MLLPQALGSVAGHDGNLVLESNTAENDGAETAGGFSQEDYDYDPTSIRRTKEETYDVEEAIQDLWHISTALGQILMSISHDSKLEFAVIPLKDVSYQRFTSIPSGPNMGHQRLTLKSPQNTHFLTQESELYKLLIALRTLCFPETHLLDHCHCDILAQVEEGLFQVDRIRAAAWDHAANRRNAELALDGSGEKHAGNAIVVNSGDTMPFLDNSSKLIYFSSDAYFRRDKQDFHPATVACYFLVLALNLLCGVSNAHSDFVAATLRFVMQHLVINTDLSTADRNLLTQFPHDSRTLLNHFDLNPKL